MTASVHEAERFVHEYLIDTIPTRTHERREHIVRDCGELLAACLSYGPVALIEEPLADLERRYRPFTTFGRVFPDAPEPWTYEHSDLLVTPFARELVARRAIVELATSLAARLLGEVPETFRARAKLSGGHGAWDRQAEASQRARDEFDPQAFLEVLLVGAADADERARLRSWLESAVRWALRAAPADASPELAERLLELLRQLRRLYAVRAPLTLDHRRFPGGVGSLRALESLLFEAFQQPGVPVVVKWHDWSATPYDRALFHGRDTDVWATNGAALPLRVGWNKDARALVAATGGPGRRVST